MIRNKRVEDAVAEEAPGVTKEAPAAGNPVPTLVRGAALPAAPTALRPLVTVTRQSLVAASNQFNGMAHFGLDQASAVSIGDRAQDGASLSKAGLDRFLQDRAFAVDQHGDLHDYRGYLRAAEAIQAKAVALGYGAQAKAVPIDTVPGGYVGRYEGSDIYAPGQ